MVRLITWYLVICLWESIVTSSLVKTSITGTKTICVPFPFCSLFLTVIQLLCFYSCYSLPPTPIHNFCWGRLKGTKELIIFEPCHTFLARFLLMRDQDRISPNSINTISSRKRRKKEQMKERIYMGFTNMKYLWNPCLQNHYRYLNTRRRGTIAWKNCRDNFDKIGTPRVANHGRYSPPCVSWRVKPKQSN